MSTVKNCTSIQNTKSFNTKLLTTYRIKYVFQTKGGYRNMIKMTAGKNESKTLTKHM